MTIRLAHNHHRLFPHLLLSSPSQGLTPDMGPDPIIKETPIDWIKSIGVTQIVSLGGCECRAERV